jgi:hypothetical protein
MKNKNTASITLAITRLNRLARAPRAHRRWTTAAIALLSALLTAVGLVAASAPATAHRAQGHGDRHGQVVVRSSPDGLTLSRNVTHAGKVTIAVKSLYGIEDGHHLAGGAFMLKLIPPATLSTVRADFKDEFSDDRTVAARGTRNLTRHARFYGLAEVSHKGTVSVTQRLSAGTYYLFDNPELIEGTPHLVPLTVVGRSHDHDAQKTRQRPTVTMTAKNRFNVPPHLPAKGTISVRNRSDTPHFMQVWPVPPNTTDKAVQAWLDAGAPGEPFSVESQSMALYLLSPGQTAQLTYDLPAGRYLLLCEFRDAKTGKAHVFMGMHKVVTLK